MTTRALTAPVETNEVYDQTLADLAFAMQRRVLVGELTISEHAPKWMQDLWQEVTELSTEVEREADLFRSQRAVDALYAIAQNGPHARLEASDDSSELVGWLSHAPNFRTGICDEVLKDGEDIGPGKLLDILMAGQQREINDIVETLTEGICARIDHSTVT